jgi:predicted signal transduction protein with EAL and GGDEF domain
VFVDASIGIAIGGAGDEADALIRNADVAMYAAKARGKGQSARYEATMHDRALARLRLEADLRPPSPSSTRRTRRRRFTSRSSRS